MDFWLKENPVAALAFGVFVVSMIRVVLRTNGDAIKARERRKAEKAKLMAKKTN